MDKALQQGSIDWNSIFDCFGTDIDAVSKGRAAVSLACGDSIANVSKTLGIEISTIERWKNDDHVFGLVYDAVRQNMAAYLDSRLPLRMVQADDVMGQFLTADPINDTSIPNAMRTQILKEKAAAARLLYSAVLDKNSKNKNPTIQISQAVFNMGQSALDVLASRLGNEPVDVTPVKEDVVDAQEKPEGD